MPYGRSALLNVFALRPSKTPPTQEDRQSRLQNTVVTEVWEGAIPSVYSQHRPYFYSCEHSSKQDSKALRRD